jgi:hypothetical protein
MKEDLQKNGRQPKKKLKNGRQPHENKMEDDLSSVQKMKMEDDLSSAQHRQQAKIYCQSLKKSTLAVT